MQHKEKQLFIEAQRFFYLRFILITPSLKPFSTVLGAFCFLRLSHLNCFILSHGSDFEAAQRVQNAVKED